MIHEGAMGTGGAMRTGAAPRKALRIGLWVAQGLLAAAFGLAGFAHATQPIAELATHAPWTGAMPAALVRFIGIVEICGALGLLLPSLTRVRPVLTVWAARGLLTVMALACIVHLTRGEPQVLPVNFVLGGLALFIGWGRSRLAPIAPRA
jgi:uncharacterized membrane protein